MTEDTHTNHAHEPAEAVAAFCHTCKHCGVLIEATHCPACDGVGSFGSLLGRFECKDCNGTGVKRWVEVQ